LRKLAGQKEISLPGTSLISALNNLVQQDPALGEAIFENEEIHPHLLITINGQNITDKNIQVAEEDIIAIFPPIAGG
jgi:molybdopterin converting factor small subunit